MLSFFTLSRNTLLSLPVIVSCEPPLFIYLCILLRTLSPAKENETRAQDHT